MKRSGGRNRGALWLVAAVLTVGAMAGPVRATEADMALLPVVEPFRCLICHVEADPTAGSFALNVFGDDFLANGRRWDAALAVMDSDGDGCSNGVELGDADGDGIADGNVSTLTSNPGEHGDCGELVIDSRTWGALKSLFDRR
jgi:hypothetical protein